jgi:putative IMPACT (imprinted ancient) family translation regulator
MANATGDRYMTVAQVIDLIKMVDKAIEEECAVQSAQGEKEENKSVTSQNQNLGGANVTFHLSHQCRKRGQQAKECESSLSCSKGEHTKRE